MPVSEQNLTADPAAVGACEHSTLVAVDGIFAFYRCQVCGHYFNLQLLNSVRYTPHDVARVALYMWKDVALQEPDYVHELFERFEREDVRPHGVPQNGTGNPPEPTTP